MRWKVPVWKLEERVINVRRSTGDISKENNTEQPSEREPINLTFLNGSIKNKYIYKMFQIECLVNAVYNINAYVLLHFLFLWHSSFVVEMSVFCKNDVNWYSRPENYWPTHSQAHNWILAVSGEE